MTIPKKGTSQLRKGRFSQAGMIYFVTKTTIQRVSKNDPPENGLLMYGNRSREVVTQSEGIFMSERTHAWGTSTQAQVRRLLKQNCTC